MAGFFKRILGKKSLTDQLRDELRSAYDPKKEADRIGLAMLVILQKQLDLLGFEIGTVPMQEPFTSHKCRGYLCGLALGILSGEGVEWTDDAIIDSVVAAFGLTYGDPAGRDLSFQTAMEFRDNKPETVSAADWAFKDVRGVYDSGGVTNTLGFYLAAQGHSFAGSD